MPDSFNEIQNLLQRRAEYDARLRLLPYDGTPEIKTINEQRYLYSRKRVGSRTTSTYAGVYSDELYQQMLRDARDARELRKQIRHADKALAELGYAGGSLSPRVVENLDFARANMKTNI